MAKEFASVVHSLYLTHRMKSSHFIYAHELWCWWTLVQVKRSLIFPQKKSCDFTTLHWWLSAQNSNVCVFEYTSEYSRVSLFWVVVPKKKYFYSFLWPPQRFFTYWLKKSIWEKFVRKTKSFKRFFSKK